MSISREEIAKITDPFHKAEREQRLKECMDNDIWANKIFKNIALLIITYPGQRAYLRSCIETHHKLGYFIAVSYDNYLDYTLLPDRDLLEKIDLFMLPHTQTWGDTDYPFFWGLKWGASVLQQFEYVYCLNGDFILEKPENFDKLLELMGDADVMGSGPDYENFFANGAFIIKTKHFIEMTKYMQNTYIPFEKYEKNVHYLHNAEERMAHFFRDYKLKMKTVDNPCIWDNIDAKPSTWFDIVGLRHIHGELDFAYKKKRIPPHYKYLDKKYLLDIYQYHLIKEYWETKDKEILIDWWLK